MNDSVGEMSSTIVSVVNVEPRDFRQAFEEKLQLISVRRNFQQTGGIRNGNFIRLCRHKEACEGRGGAKITIWLKDKAFNGLLTLVDDQRARIEVSGAIRIKDEVTDPKLKMVPQDTFVFHHFMDMNPIWVFVHKPPQALSIQGIIGVSYPPEGFGCVFIYPKCKVY